MRLQLDGSIKIISAGNWQVGGRIRSLSLLLRGSVHIITRSSVSPATQASDVRVREVYFGPNFKSALLVNILRPNQKAIEKSIKFGDLSSTELERCTLHSG